MKLNDVVAQLHLILPKYTNKLSNVLGISSIAVTGGVGTITTTLPHKIVSGNPVTISNATFHNPLSTVVKAGNLFTYTTVADHDLTEGWQDTVKLSGFNDPLWNGADLTLMSVPDRNTFVVQSLNSLPVLNGLEVLLEARSDGINNRHSASVVSTTVFTIPGIALNGVYSGGSVNSSVRIAGAVTIERAFEQYTEQSVNDLWAFVVMNDMDVSKDRNSFSDATATKATGEDLRLKILDGFTVTFIHNVSNEIAAVDALDISRHDLFLPLMKSVFGARFPSGLANQMDYKTVPVSMGLSLYNRAVMAYTYAFEVPYELTNDDSVEDLNSSAFRDVDFTHIIGNTDTQDITVNPIKLDQ